MRNERSKGKSSQQSQSGQSHQQQAGNPQQRPEQQQQGNPNDPLRNPDGSGQQYQHGDHTDQQGGGASPADIQNRKQKDRHQQG